MEKIMEYLDMGGYGAFVWPSYAATAGVLLVMLVASLRMLRANEAALKELETSTSTKEEAGETKA